MLIGGADYQHNNLSDVWEWDGVQWSETATSSPLACTPGRVVYDEALPNGPGFVEVEPGLAATVGTWTGQAYAWTRAALPSVGDLSPTSLALDPTTLLLVTSVVVDPHAGPVQLWTWNGVSPTGWALAGTVPSWTTGSIPPPTLLPMADRLTQGTTLALAAAIHGASPRGRSLSSRSTAARFPRAWWSRSWLLKALHQRGRTATGSSALPTGAPSSWTRSVSCRWPPR